MKTQEGRSGESVRFDRDLSSGGALGAGEGVSRRGFMGGMGAMMAAAALAATGSASASADEADGADEDEYAEAEESEAEEETDERLQASGVDETDADRYINYPTIESVTGWTGTPEDTLALGVSTMPLDDLNQYRQAYMDAQTEFTKEDGTVVPVAYVKMRALINTYGMGCGNEPSDTSFDTLMLLFTEEEVEAYINMPMGVEFTAYEAAAKLGIETDEAEEICETFVANGYMLAADKNRGRVYHQIAYFQGSAEYSQMRRADDDPDNDTDILGDDGLDYANTGTPTFYFVPVDASVTYDGTILPFDDLKEKVKNANYACISPCSCRYGALRNTYGQENIPSWEDFQTGEYEDYFSDLCNQRVETCIQIGDEAKYWVELGYGREITGEQAAEYLQRSVDDGFMLETTFGKDSDTICSCHADSCGILMLWDSLGDAEAIAATDAFKQISHYTLEVDPDLCIACGTCVDRCPMHIISINDEGWAEPAANCFRCGQCAYVCPQNARHLVERDESELAPLPQGMLEDSNVKAAYRFEQGLIPFPEA